MGKSRVFEKWPHLNVAKKNVDHIMKSRHSINFDLDDWKFLEDFFDNLRKIKFLKYLNKFWQASNLWTLFFFD